MGSILNTSPVDLSPELLAELAIGYDPPDVILSRAGLSPADIQRLLSDDRLRERVEAERQAMEQSGDLDVYYNRLCYRMMRNKMVAMGLAGKMGANEMVKAVDMLRRHAGLDKDDSAPAGVAASAPVLNIIVDNAPQDAPAPTAPGVTIVQQPVDDASSPAIDLPAPPAHVLSSNPNLETLLESISHGVED